MGGKCSRSPELYHMYLKKACESMNLGRNLRSLGRLVG